jgi:O-antigen/teichoic acid export membrane protein
MPMPDHLRRLAASLDSTTMGWAKLLSGDLLRMGLSFAAGILVARALGPAEFGVYAVLAAAVGIGGAVADLGLSNAAIYRVARVWPEDPDLARQRGQSFFWARVSSATAVAAAAIGLARWLAPVLGLPSAVGPYRSSALLALALAGVAATALSGAVSALLQATGHFGRIGIVLLTNAGLTLALAAALSVVGRINLVTVLVVLGIVPSLAAFGVGRRLLGATFTLAPPPWARFRDETATLLRFGGWLWVASILAAVASQLDVLMVNRTSSAAVVGAYGLALGLAAAAEAANRSLYAALLPAASALRSPAELRRYLRHAVLRSTGLALLLVPLLPLARPLIIHLYGAEFSAAVPLFRLFLAVVALEVFVTPWMLLAFPLERPRWLAGAELLRVIVLAAAASALMPLWGPAGAVAAKFAARAAGAAALLILLARHWPSIRERWSSDAEATTPSAHE